MEKAVSTLFSKTFYSRPIVSYGLQSNQSQTLPHLEVGSPLGILNENPASQEYVQMLSTLFPSVHSTFPFVGGLRGGLQNDSEKQNTCKL